jgi:hypothetical protein
MIEGIDLKGIEEKSARELIQRLMNLIEQQAGDLREARGEIQRLRDEINRLKGEQGKPNIKGNTRKEKTADLSSEKERKQTRPRHKSAKKADIKIDRKEVVKLDRESLPKDAEFKGYAEVVVQDIVVKTDNVLFLKEKYYSAMTGKSYQAELPARYEGQFGPGVQVLVLTLYYGMGTSEPKIGEFLENVGVKISEGEISNLLIKGKEPFHAEKAEVYEAGLRSSPYQGIDDTQTRVDGKNQHCHVVCNPVYTIYQTQANKTRLSVLDVLRQGRERIFLLNEEAMGYLEGIQLAPSTRAILKAGCGQVAMDEATFLSWLKTNLPNLGKHQHPAVLDAAAVAAYHAEKRVAIVQMLICDDAPQFNWLTDKKGLCWVHEGRHYKKLNPVIPLHREWLDDFVQRFWAFYHQLLGYRLKPTSDERKRLEADFDALFSLQTGYADLDRCIAKTCAHKTNLLWVLQFPEIPLHNNASELAVRQRVRKRDVSFGPRTQAGLRSWDTFMSLADTTRKLGVSFYHYIQDRITGVYQIPPLATLVELAAKQLNLGCSFVSV